jgi:hypothetical protein
MEKNTRQQEQIIRQSQISTAVNYFTLIGKKPSMVDLIKVSTMMEKFIHEGYSKSMVELMEKVDEHIMGIQDEKQKRIEELIEKRRKKNENHNDIY